MWLYLITRYNWCCCFTWMMTPLVANTIQNKWDLWTGCICLSYTRMQWQTYWENYLGLAKLLRPHIMVVFGCNKYGSFSHFFLFLVFILSDSNIDYCSPSPNFLLITLESSISLLNVSFTSLHWGQNVYG